MHDSTPRDVLLLGGGVFLGRATLAALCRQGHRVTVFNRGLARSDWPDGVAVLQGDRRHDLGALVGRRWDAVIDTCGYVPVDVALSAQQLRDCGRYLFVSTISAYASTSQVPITEADPLASFAHLATDDRSPQHYGAQKAACEAEVQRVFGPRATIVRPGLIVGPGDPTGRFSRWPWRMREGGAMLVPDMPDDAVLQLIDVRDLGDWLVQLVEADAGGVFNAVGPVDDAPLIWRALWQACADAVRAQGVEPAHCVSVGEAWLKAQGVQPWTELPLWLPSTDPDLAGFHRVDATRSRAAGLRTRSLRDTVAAVLAEPAPPADDPRCQGKLTRAREAQLLAAAPR